VIGAAPKLSRSTDWKGKRHWQLSKDGQRRNQSIPLSLDAAKFKFAQWHDG